MSMPDDQIGWFRMRYAPESFRAIIQIFGVSVRIREARALVDGMHQMRAIASQHTSFPGTQRNGNDGRAVVLVQRPMPGSVSVVAFVAGGSRTLKCALCDRNTCTSQRANHDDSESPATPHCYILMPFRYGAASYDCESPVSRVIEDEQSVALRERVSRAKI